MVFNNTVGKGSSIHKQCVEGRPGGGGGGGGGDYNISRYIAGQEWGQGRKEEGKIKNVSLPSGLNSTGKHWPLNSAQIKYTP